MKPTISIIIPVFNCETYIDECIRSVINQTYKNLEIICIDDGSTDCSGLILDSYSECDCRIKVIHTKNNGVSNARNIGLDMVTGDYIGFIDADDYALPQMYEILINLLIDEDADISIVSFSNFQSVVKKDYFAVYDKKTATRELNIGSTFAGYLHNKLFRANLWKNVRFNTNIKNCEDLLALNYIFPKAKKVVFKNTGLYFYRQTLQSASRGSVSLGYLTAIDAAEEIYDVILKYQPELVDVAREVVCRISFNIVEKILYNYSEKEYRKILFKSINLYRRHYVNVNNDRKMITIKHVTLKKCYPLYYVLCCINRVIKYKKH